MRVSSIWKRISVLVGTFFFLHACETIPSNPLSPDVRDSLKVADVKVSLDPAWITSLEERARKTALRKAKKEHTLAIAKANSKKRKTIPEPSVDDAEVKAAVDKNVQGMIAALDTALRDKFKDYPGGTRPVVIEAKVLSYHAANAGETILLGYNQNIYGVAKVVDQRTNAVLAMYDIKVIQTNQGGLFVALFDAMLFGDKQKDLSNMFARDLMGLMKRNDYTGEVHQSATTTPVTKYAW